MEVNLKYYDPERLMAFISVSLEHHSKKLQLLMAFMGKDSDFPNISLHCLQDTLCKFGMKHLSPIITAVNIAYLRIM